MGLARAGQKVLAALNGEALGLGIAYDGDVVYKSSYDFNVSTIIGVAEVTTSATQLIEFGGLITWTGEQADFGFSPTTNLIYVNGGQAQGVVEKYEIKGPGVDIVLRTADATYSSSSSNATFRWDVSTPSLTNGALYTLKATLAKSLVTFRTANIDTGEGQNRYRAVGYLLRNPTTAGSTDTRVVAGGELTRAVRVIENGAYNAQPVNTFILSILGKTGRIAGFDSVTIVGPQVNTTLFADDPRFRQVATNNAQNAYIYWEGVDLNLQANADYTMEFGFLRFQNEFRFNFQFGGDFIFSISCASITASRWPKIDENALQWDYHQLKDLGEVIQTLPINRFVFAEDTMQIQFSSYQSDVTLVPFSGIFSAYESVTIKNVDTGVEFSFDFADVSFENSNTLEWSATETQYNQISAGGNILVLTFNPADTERWINREAWNSNEEWEDE